jgi:hypothetical protein
VILFFGNVVHLFIYFYYSTVTIQCKVQYSFVNIDQLFIQMLFFIESGALPVGLTLIT